MTQAACSNSGLPLPEIRGWDAGDGVAGRLRCAGCRPRLCPARRCCSQNAAPGAASPARSATVLTTSACTTGVGGALLGQLVTSVRSRREPGTACPLFHVAPGPGPGVSPGQVDPQLLPDPASGSCLRPGWPAPPHAARQTLARVGRGRSWPRTARRPLLPRPAASRPPSLPPSSAHPAPEPAELRVAGTGCDPCPGGRSPVLAAESDRI